MPTVSIRDFTINIPDDLERLARLWAAERGLLSPELRSGLDGLMVYMTADLNCVKLGQLAGALTLENPWLGFTD